MDEGFNELVNSLVSKGIPYREAVESCQYAIDFVNDNLPVEPIEDFDFVLENSVGGEEERYVLGAVLIPNHADLNGTMFPESTVRRTAFNFMEKYQSNKFMHLLGLNKEDVTIVESYILPQDTILNGKRHKKGTWMMGIKVKNDTLWGYIKSGKITGYSIGARATGSLVSIKG